LFISIRMAASCGQPLQVRDVPRGARTIRVTVAIESGDDGKLDLKKRRERCQTENEKFFT
jgi:hypothetical protein